MPLLYGATCSPGLVSPGIFTTRQSSILLACAPARRALSQNREREHGLGHLDFSLDDAAATRALGARLAAVCPPDAVILLRGPLGAGKTTFVEGFLDRLGAGHAASPTFVIAHAHAVGVMPIWHLDLYRLEDPRDVEDLDLAHYFPPGGITLVEWPERAAHEWPLDRIEIDLAIAGLARTGHVQGFGKAEDVVRALEIDAVPRS